MGMIEEARRDLERAAKVAPAGRAAECAAALEQLRRSLRGPAARHLWRPSAALRQQLASAGGAAEAPPPPRASASAAASVAAAPLRGGRHELLALPLVVQVTSDSGRKFRLFVAQVPGKEREVWGGLEKPDGKLVKYVGVVDCTRGTLRLEHQDSLAVSGVPPLCTGAGGDNGIDCSKN
jgi:hypothetical protein